MRTPARILIADDNTDNIEIFRMRLQRQGYEIVTVGDGDEALAAAREYLPDLILLDIMMPKVDGITACQHLKSDPSLPFIPIVMLTAKSSTQDVVAALDAGADEYLIKPVDHGALVARVKSMLRIKDLSDTVREQNARLACWNAELETRVNEQVQQLERLSRLKRFFSPHLAEAILSGDKRDPLATHRREVAVVFLDLRGFTAFAETAEPEEVMRILREYHAEMGKFIVAYEGTLERFTGDGMMIFFNDPVVIEKPAERAVRMAIEMRDRAAEISAQWKRFGSNLSLGIGIAQGYATIGAIGFEGRIDYGAIGTVTNLAARLCGDAKSGQILTDRRTLSHVEHIVRAEAVGEVSLKGFSRPIDTYAISCLTES